MKIRALFILLLASLHVLGQIDKDPLVGKSNGIKVLEKAINLEQDTVPRVSHLKVAKKESNVLYYLNGEVVDEHILNTLNPNKIKTVKVEKESIASEKTRYEGIIRIQTKDNYEPKLITLNALKSKYLNLNDKSPTLFMLDEKVIHMDYDEYQVDENYILKIEVQSVANSKEQLNLHVVRLITRTQENIKKVNTIRLK